jgi:hypothetical protein
MVWSLVRARGFMHGRGRHVAVIFGLMNGAERSGGRLASDVTQSTDFYDTEFCFWSRIPHLWGADVDHVAPPGKHMPGRVRHIVCTRVR